MSGENLGERDKPFTPAVRMEDLIETTDSERVLADPEIQDVIERRGIKPEDHEVLVRLAGADKNELIGLYHNFFAGHANVENARDEYARRISRQLEGHRRSLEEARGAGDSFEADRLEQDAILDAGMLELVQKYDTYTAVDVQRVLEEYGS